MNSILDDALERLRGMGPEAVHGAPNHGPMAAEALVALGCPDEVSRWIDDYRRELGPLPLTQAPVTENRWQEALGAPHRVADWQTFFVMRLAEDPWTRVFAQWVHRLITGLMAAGTASRSAVARGAPAVLTRSIPSDGHPIPAVGLGTWQTYDVGPSPAERAPARPSGSRHSTGSRRADR